MTFILNQKECNQIDRKNDVNKKKIDYGKKILTYFYKETLFVTEDIRYLQNTRTVQFEGPGIFFNRSLCTFIVQDKYNISLLLRKEKTNFGNDDNRLVGKLEDLF